jgi:hypothetical protein
LLANSRTIILLILRFLAIISGSLVLILNKLQIDWTIRKIYIKIEIYIHLKLTLSIWLNYNLILDWLSARRTLDIIRLIANLNTISWNYCLYHRNLLRESRLYIQKIILLRLYLNMILHSIFILDMVLSIWFWNRIIYDILIFVFNVTDGDMHNFI